MSDEQFDSKRERQKARRAARLEQEAAQAVVQDRKRTLTYGLAGLLVVALIGGLIFNQIRKGQEADAEAEAAVAMLDDLGCTEDAEQTDLGGGHIAGDAASLAAEAPEIIYPDEPASSGRHIGSVVASGIYDIPVDPRFTTHNLEHGYVVGWYSPDAPADQIEAFKAWGRDAMDGDFPKIVVAEYYKPLPEDVNFSLTAWDFRQNCRDFATEVANTFTRAHYDINGQGPEKGLPTHNLGGQGVVDPTEEGQNFLPPLGGDVSGEAAEDNAADDAASEEETEAES